MCRCRGFGRDHELCERLAVRLLPKSSSRQVSVSGSFPIVEDIAGVEQHVATAVEL